MRLFAAGLLVEGTSARHVEALVRVYRASIDAAHRYLPARAHVDVHVLASERLISRFPNDLTLGWGSATTGRVCVHAVPGDHESMLEAEGIPDLAVRLHACLDGSLEKPGGAEASSAAGGSF
jgi:thioesterase domain-containing protein